MAESTCSPRALNLLAWILGEEIEEGVRSVMGGGEQVCKFIGNFLSLQRVLEDAENRELKDDNVGVWLAKLKDRLYDIYDVFDECNTAVGRLKLKEDNPSDRLINRPIRRSEVRAPTRRKVCSFIPPYLSHYKHLVLHIDLAFRIKKLNKTLDEMMREKYKFKLKSSKATRVVKQQVTTSFIDILSEVHGRDEEKEKIFNYLFGEGSDGPTLPIICIVGPKGVGKTALARLIFNDKDVKTHFDQRIWVSVSYPCDDIRVAKAILKSLKDDAPNLDEFEIVLQHIRRYIKGKRFLLVLDDLETENLKSWEELNYSLKCGSEGSRILVTTCKENGVKEIETLPAIPLRIETLSAIPLRMLSEEDSWALFRQVACFEAERNEECVKLEEIGRTLVGRCEGLPLAIKILGCFLRIQRNVDEWQNILHSEIWELAPKKELFAPLLLSYHGLPTILRKCFSYCAIFPKNCEIEKNRLIKLWMSQDYLKIEGKEDMESIGEEYFENLVMHSFFHDFRRSEYDGSIISFKLHDIVRNFAQLLRKNENFITKVGGSEKPESEISYENIKHLMVMFEGGGSFPIQVYNGRKLRSLMVEPKGGFMSDVDLPKLFDQLTCLRALDLSNHDNVWFEAIKEVPRGIKNLTHLRYLNFSKNRKIRELPEVLCELYNLQTLELSWCINLNNLPQGIKKLINLRHIVNGGTSLRNMPKGVEKLTSLRTLSEFVASCDGDGSRSNLEYLKYLNHLQFLSIKKLGNVIDASKKAKRKDNVTGADEVKKAKHKGYVTLENEVEKAKLKDKEDLHSLGLSFQRDVEMGPMNKHDESALENLQMPPNLERLEISHYRGKVMSSDWIMSLNKLRLMSLEQCKNLEHMPRLGVLPSLETLIIRGMKSVKLVGNEFLGMEGNVISLSSSEAFPRLKYLEFWKMLEWKDWNYENVKMKKEDVEIMPYLCSVKIGFCPKLETLPRYISQRKNLEELKIISCPKLEQYEEKRKETAGTRSLISKFYHD